MGLIVARLIVTRLLSPGEPITVVIDDTLFKRWGRQVLTRSGPTTAPPRAARRSPGATGG
jgi:hypothetical protein